MISSFAPSSVSEDTLATTRRETHLYFAKSGVMILSATIFLGFCAESHSTAPIIWSKGIPMHSEPHNIASPMLRTQPEANEEVVHQQNIPNDTQNRPPQNIYALSNLSPSSSTTTMSSAPDHRTFWQKIKDVVKVGHSIPRIGLQRGTN